MTTDTPPSDDFPVLVEGTRTLTSTKKRPSIAANLLDEARQSVARIGGIVAQSEDIESTFWVSMMAIITVNQEKTTLLKHTKDMITHRLRKPIRDSVRKVSMQKAYLPSTRRIARFHDPGALTFESLERINA